MFHQTPGNIQVDNAYHVPVMLEPCLDALHIQPEGTYADLTFGGGGHSQGILGRLGPEGKLFGFDQDPDARANADRLADRRLTLIQANFRYLKKYLKVYGVSQADGILADLGISSYQIDQPDRGFSTRFEGPLDMRMNPAQALSAQTVVNEYTEEQLKNVLRLYGELPQSGKIARFIMRQRTSRPLRTTSELAEAVRPLAPRGKEYKFFAQVFQAIRIEVNDEMGALRELLEQLPEVLKPGGKVVFLTYHSLEDRMVKNYLRSGNVEGEQQKDLYGNLLRPLRPLHNKAIQPSAQEIEMNRRARSAKLRAAERL